MKYVLLVLYLLALGYVAGEMLVAFTGNVLAAYAAAFLAGFLPYPKALR